MNLEPAVERFLASAGLADSTRRAYASDLRDFAEWYGNGAVEKIDTRLLAEYTADLGRARPGGKLSPATISRRLSAVRALLRFSLGREPCPRNAARAASRQEAARGAEGRGRRGADLAVRRRRRRSPSGTARCSSSCTRPAFAAARSSGSISATSTSSRSTCSCGTAKARRSGSSRSARSPRISSPATSVRAAPSWHAAPRTRSSSRLAGGGSTPRRSAASCPIHTASATRSPPICSKAAPTCGRSRSCSGTRRSRRRRSTAT